MLVQFYYMTEGEFARRELRAVGSEVAVPAASWRKDLDQRFEDLVGAHDNLPPLIAVGVLGDPPGSAVIGAEMVADWAPSPERPRRMVWLVQSLEEMVDQKLRDRKRRNG